MMDRKKVFNVAWELFKRQDNAFPFGECLSLAWARVKGECLIAELYGEYYKKIYWYIQGKVKRADVAEDFTQEVFVRAQLHVGDYNPSRAKAVTWLYTIATNLVIDYYRGDSKRKMVVGVSDFQDELGRETYQIAGHKCYETDNLVETDELRLQIDRAFQSLRPKYRQIATLFFIENKQYAEIAELCQVPMGTVKGLLNRCRAILQERLKAYEIVL